MHVMYVTHLQLGNTMHSNESLSHFHYCVYVTIKIELSCSKYFKLNIQNMLTYNKYISYIVFLSTVILQYLGKNLQPKFDRAAA